MESVMNVIEGEGASKIFKCPNPECNDGEVKDNGPKACMQCGGNGFIDPDWFYPELKVLKHE